MTQLNLPTLSLFNSHQRGTKNIKNTTKKDYALLQGSKTANDLQNNYNAFHRPSSSSSIYQEEGRRINDQVELNYMKKYYNTLRSQGLSLHSTQKAESLQRKKKYNTRMICDCDQPHFKIQCPQNIIMKSPYLNHQSHPIHIAEQDQQPASNLSIKKQAYLRPKELKEPQRNIQKYPQKHNQYNLQAKKQNKIPIIRTVHEPDPNFIERLVSNQSKSIIIQQPKPKKLMVSQQIQTEDPKADRSLFLIDRVLKKVPQIMNQKNFQKAIKNLDKEINSIKLNLQSNDMIIDLTDLMSSKDQYVDQSKRLLTNLNVLSLGKINSQLIKTSKNNDGLVWPHGV